MDTNEMNNGDKWKMGKGMAEINLQGEYLKKCHQSIGVTEES